MNLVFAKQEENLIFAKQEESMAILLVWLSLHSDLHHLNVDGGHAVGAIILFVSLTKHRNQIKAGKRSLLFVCVCLPFFVGLRGGGWDTLYQFCLKFRTNNVCLFCNAMLCKKCSTRTWDSG